MPRKVVLVGHCGPDSSYLRMAVSSAARDIRVSAADTSAELQRVLKDQPDLLLLNRVLEWGFDESEGVDLIRRLRAEHPNLKMMLVSNYADAQQAAVEAGALPGFGKRELGTAKVTQMLRSALETESAKL